MTHCLTASEALARMATYPQEDLADMVQEAHKDHYGVRGRWAYDAPAHNLVCWWSQHYTWNEYDGVWHGNWEPEGEELVTQEAASEGVTIDMTREEYLEEMLSLRYDPRYVLRRMSIPPMLLSI